MNPNPLPIAFRPTTNDELLPCSSLGSLVQTCLDALHAQQYAACTIDRYIAVLQHFDRWIQVSGLGLEEVSATIINRFVHSHLPTCACNLKLHSRPGEARAALGHLLKLLPDALSQPSRPLDPIAAELEKFADYLRRVRGLMPGTVGYFCRDVGALLS